MHVKNHNLTFIEKLKEYVANNNLKTACELLRNSSFSEDGILLLRRLNDNAQRHRRRTIDDKIFQEELNKISNSILDIVKDIQEGSRELAYVPETIVYPNQGDKTNSFFINQVATKYLSGLDRIEESKIFAFTTGNPKLFLPKTKEVYYTLEGSIIVKEKKKEEKLKISELVTLIEIKNELDAKYKETGIISVRSHLENVNPRPITVNVQSLTLCHINPQNRNQILKFINENKNEYGRKKHDKIWVEDNDPAETLEKDDILIVMNRRIGGWSGSPEDPKIELLLGGGAMPTVWDDENEALYQLKPKEVIKKEFQEELKYSLGEEDIEIIGGFLNKVTSQLVILCLVIVESDQLSILQKGALDNVEEKIDGIYLGRLQTVLQQYFTDPDPFVGGRKAVATNFPSQADLMRRVKNRIYEKFKLWLTFDEEINRGGMSSEIDTLSNILLRNDELSTSFRKVKEMSKTLMKLVGYGIDWPAFLDNLDQYAYKILKPELDDWGLMDKYCLCCSIYLHRIGLIGSVHESPEEVYDSYSKRSKEIILKYGNDFSLEPEMVEDIAWIVFGHRNVPGFEDRSIDSSELLKPIRSGNFTRQRISFYLKILSNLSILNSFVPRGFYDIFFPNDLNKLYNDFSSIQSFSGVDIVDNEKVSKIYLKIGEFKENNLIPSLKIIMQTQRRLATEIRRFNTPLSINSVFSNLDVIKIRESSFSKNMHLYIERGFLIKDLEKAIKTAIEALIEAKYPHKEKGLNGWGPSFVVNHEEDDFKHFQDARVANTFEVLLALSNHRVYEGHLELMKKVKETIKEVLSSLNSVRISRIAPNRVVEIQNEIDDLKKRMQYLNPNDPQFKVIDKRLKSLEVKNKAEIQFDPFPSLTYKVPTFRVNSIPVLAFSYLLGTEKENFLDEPTYQLIKSQMKKCILWICETNSNPFDENEMLNDNHIFQFILSMKALVRSEKYWNELQISKGYRFKLYDKIATFIDSLNIEIARQRWPKSPYKAMALEILVSYLQFSEQGYLVNKTKVKFLINEIVESLFEEIKITNFEIWKDATAVIRDNEDPDDPKLREWTHITRVWAIEGLCQCHLADQLNETQYKKLMECIPILLLSQDEDGFFSPSSEKNPYYRTTKYIYKTALCTHALNQAYSILRNKII